MATTHTSKTQPLYRVLIKSLSHPDGIEKLLCKRCAEHSKYLVNSGGPRWYIRGEAFTYLDNSGTEKVGGFTFWPLSHTEGVCPECDYRIESERRIIANIEGVRPKDVRFHEDRS